MQSFAQLPCVRDTFSEASDAIGRDMWKLVDEGPADELNLTVDTVRAIALTGATHIVECGPGKVLAGLNKRIAPETQAFSFSDEPAFREALTTLT